MKHYLSYFDDAVKEFWNMPAFTNYGADTLTYGQVAEGIEKYHILFKACGINKGDKISLCSKNSAQWGVAYLATVAYDAVIVPLLPDFLPRSVVELTSFSGCRMLILDDGIYGSIIAKKGLIDTLKNQSDFLGVINVHNMQAYESYNTQLPVAIYSIESQYSKSYPNGLKPEMVDYKKSDLEALSIISFTSGTSSSPKGVMLPAKSLSFNLEFARREIPAHAGGRILSILPLAHMFGQTFDFLLPLSKGCHITIFGQKPTPARLLAGLADVKPFMFLTVPMVVEKIFRSKIIPALKKPVMRVALSIPGINSLLYGSIKKKLLKTFGGELEQGIIVGGAALNQEVEDLLRKMKFPISVGYGMTECGPLISYTDFRKFAPYSCGKIARPIVVRIESRDAANMPGEIQVTGDAVMLGYYNNEIATQATFTEDGWLKTGDMGTLDEYENVFIKGRCKNMILTGSGQNIYPEEIEDKINNLPHVTESIVVERKGLLIALIVPNFDTAKAEKLNDTSLLQLMEQNIKEMNKSLPAYSKIAFCELMKEPFEKTPKQSIKRFMYS